MALNAYLRMVGTKTGTVQGSVTTKGREGKIMVIALRHEIVSPRDPASGLATGKRQHEPLTITKELDRSSPILHAMQANNEAIKEWELQFYRPSTSTGVETQHFTIRLTNAAIASIRMEMPNNKRPELTGLETFEEVAFVYERIEWTWTEGAITASDGTIDL